MSHVDLMESENDVVTDDQKRSYKKKMRKFRRKLRFIRKSKARALKFMNMALSLDHDSQREINQSYYREKIEELSNKEDAVLSAKKDFKKQNSFIRDAIKFEKSLNKIDNSVGLNCS